MRTALTTSILASAFIINGCSQISDTSNGELQSSLIQGQYQSQVTTKDNSGQASIRVSAKRDINYYVQGLMYRLLDNIYGVSDETPLAVTSFVNTDSNFQDTNILGNQLAESFIHEAHNSGLSVVDYKTTDYIRVTQLGDFVFSRDYRELGESAPIIYVLSGTMTKDREGYLINARIVELESKVVAATAQSHIPQSVVDAMQEEIETGIRLR